MCLLLAFAPSRVLRMAASFLMIVTCPRMWTYLSIVSLMRCTLLGRSRRSLPLLLRPFPLSSSPSGGSPFFLGTDPTSAAAARRRAAGLSVMPEGGARREAMTERLNEALETVAR